MAHLGPGCLTLSPHRALCLILDATTRRVCDPGLFALPQHLIFCPYSGKVFIVLMNTSPLFLMHCFTQFSLALRGEFWLCVFLNADASGSPGLRAPTFWWLTSISSPLLLSFLPKPTSLLFFWISVYFRVILEKYRKNRNIVQGVSMAQFPLLSECDITIAYLNPC